mgnify:CR=1 FL=1
MDETHRRLKVEGERGGNDGSQPCPLSSAILEKTNYEVNGSNSLWGHPTYSSCCLIFRGPTANLMNHMG